MTKEQKKFEWLITIGIFILIILIVLRLPLIKEIRATKNVNNIKIGDAFKVKVIHEDPFREDIIFEGVVIDKPGNYIKYITKDGDTSSTNARDWFLFSKTVEATINQDQIDIK